MRVRGTPETSLARLAQANNPYTVRASPRSAYATSLSWLVTLDLAQAGSPLRPVMHLWSRDSWVNVAPLTVTPVTPPFDTSYTWALVAHMPRTSTCGKQLVAIQLAGSSWRQVKVARLL